MHKQSTTNKKILQLYNHLILHSLNSLNISYNCQYDGIPYYMTALHVHGT
jgi:hypothetical protein